MACIVLTALAHLAGTGLIIDHVTCAAAWAGLGSVSVYALLTGVDRLC